MTRRLSITPARTGCVTSAAVITTPIRVRGRRGKRGSRPPPQTPPSRLFYASADCAIVGLGSRERA